MATFTLADLCVRLGGTLLPGDGAADLIITGIETLDDAGPGQLTFIGDAKYAQRWPQSRASAALISAKLISANLNGLDPGPGPGRAFIRVANADLAMAQVLELFAPPPPLAGLPPSQAPTAAHLPAIHPTAVVDPTAVLGRDVRIGAHCVVGPRASIGDRTTLYPSVTLFDDARLGADCVIWSSTVIRERCTLGDRCIIFPNVTIGADGFGFRPGPDGTPGKSLVKIPQIGNVEIGDDVEIGAGSCVDRGKFSATTIGSGTKIDNVCQISHNCRVGRDVVMAGHAGLSGSVTVGDGAVFGGKVGVADHITIGAGAMIAAYAAVMNDVPPGEKWGGVPAQPMRQFFREVAAIRKLPELLRKMPKDG